ncbi:hypothetical protein DRJ22_06335, partial [Candidatus Woesearchaeota archaeon]
AKVFGFANTEIELHRHFLKFSEGCLGISSDEFNARISVPPKLKENMKNIKKHVSEELKIPLDEFWKSQVLEQRNKIHVDIKICSRILSLTINNLFTKLQSIIESDVSFVASFLKGLIATEGNVHVRRCGRLGEIMIAIHDRQTRVWIRKLFQILGIDPSKDKEIPGDEGVLIHGFSNFKIVQEWDLCCLHPSKDKSLKIGMKGFKEIQFRKGEGQIIILKNILHGLRTSSELSRKLDKCQGTINFHLRNLHKSGLIHILETNGKRKFWCVNKKRGGGNFEFKKEGNLIFLLN